MKRILIYILCLATALASVAQDDTVMEISGTVIDKLTNDPLPGASVVVKDSGGKIKKFASSKVDGSFQMKFPGLKGGRLDVTMMGFERKSLPLDSLTFPLTVEMEAGSTLLKEVTVKSDRIREQGDTITYGVSAFAQTQDRSIGDVLKRMPGIDVSSNGKIEYQGEAINKFYIEGSDLLGGKYGIATNGINHEDVGAVEVMENHQPMQVLAGISFSDKAAINLKLKNKAKATWSVHGNAGAGWAWQPEGMLWDVGAFVMAVMPGFQNITTLKSNNTGDNISAETTDFFASGRGTDLSRYVSLSLPGVPDLSRKRTLFNRSALLSTNSLWKAGRGEFKAQVDYTFNRVTADAEGITTYFLEGGDRVVTENHRGVDRSHTLGGKFIYELNQRRAYINNTLKTDIKWDDVNIGLAGSINAHQNGRLPDYYVSNDFKLIRRFKEKHLITFQSVNEWESMPQTLRVTLYDAGNGESDAQGATGTAAGFDSQSQHIRNHAFYTHESAAYAFTVKGLSISLEGGVKGYLRTLDTSLPDLPDAIPGVTTNVVNTNYFTVYAVPKLEYWVKRVNVVLNLPLSYAHYTFDKALANRDEGYFSPSLSLNWKPSGKMSLTLRGSSGRSPMGLNMIQPGYVMTDYRSFRQGVDDFYTNTSQSVSASLTYRHTRLGLFANASAMQRWNQTPYTMAQQLYGDYVVNSYVSAKSDGESFMARGNIGKTLDFMRGSASVNGMFIRSESHLISESRTVNSVSKSWTAGLKINGAPLRWMTFDYSISLSANCLAMNGLGASWLNRMENELLINIMPHSKWEWHISGEHYRNELKSDMYKNVFLMDTKLVYKPTKRIEVSAALTNLLDERTYDYKSYNQLSSYESRRFLRGRQLLFTLTLRK